MPKAWKQRYLIRQSGGEQGCSDFNLIQSVRSTKRLLIAWPEKVEEMLIAVPAVKALIDTLGTGLACAHLAEKNLIPFLAGFFPAATMVAWEKSNLAWHDPALQTGLISLKAFSPQIAISFMHPYSLVLQAMVKATGAKIRIAISKEAIWPYSNIRIHTENTHLASSFFQPLSLWRYAGYKGAESWTRIQSDASHKKIALGQWINMSVEPSKTWVYIQEANQPALSPYLKSWFLSKLQEKGQVLDCVTLDWNLGGPQSSGENTTHLSANTPGQLLGLIQHARGIVALNGSGLHFASLTDMHCVALLKPSESAYDVSHFNRLFEPLWLESGLGFKSI